MSDEPRFWVLDDSGSVELGERARIMDGPFKNFEGTVVAIIEARGLVEVMLNIFNRPTPVEFEYWQVERI